MYYYIIIEIIIRIAYKTNILFLRMIISIIM